MNNQLMQRQEQIKPFLLSAQRQITSLLQDEAKSKKFLAASLVVASDKSLNKCSPESIVQALVGVAMSDLNIDRNIAHCYLVPYKDSVQLQIGYKGFIQLLFRAGWMVKCFPVYHCDEFNMKFTGWDNEVTFVPEIDNRDEGDRDWVFQNLRGIYVVSRHADTNDEYSTFVSKAVLEKLRKTSPNQRNAQTKPAGIWAEWYIEMCQAKAIKKLAKILPIGDDRAAVALSIDDKEETGVHVDYKRSAESGVIIQINQDDVQESINIESIIGSIGDAKSKADLDALTSDIEKLTEADKKTTRSAWMKKSKEFKSPEVEKEAKQLSPKQQIENCNSQDELMNLLQTMPEDDQLEVGDLIDMKFDSFR